MTRPIVPRPPNASAMVSIRTGTLVGSTSPKPTEKYTTPE